MNAEIHIDHVAIAAPTPIIDAVVEFYSNILDFKLGPAAEVEGLKSRWLYSGASPLLHLIEDDQRIEKGRNSFDHVALRCENLEEIVRRLEKYDIDYARFDAKKERQILVFVKDPAGTSIELNFEEVTSVDA